MNIKATILASALSLRLLRRALAADTGNRSLINAAKQGTAMRAVAVERSRRKSRRRQGAAALIAAATATTWRWSIFSWVRAQTRKPRTNTAQPRFMRSLGECGPSHYQEAVGGGPIQCGAAVGRDGAHASGPPGQRRNVRALLAAGRSQCEGKNGGQTALMWAIAERHSKVTEELVRNKVDVNAQSKNGATALMFAARAMWIRPGHCSRPAPIRISRSRLGRNA